ncbi:MAG: NAD-dependent epimerase/dehydratase family protein [Clostridiales bacterium]|nr:NAD-dependent epimerase/dehydratase family protein [Clostridiales bacterium]MCF8023839.1 NAD-dependent epimerase/dehydratase family protein [Clostridiales bacterium]
MRILVTGGAGFIGSHIIDALLKKENKVCVLDNLSSGKMENLNPGVNFYHGDLRDKEILQQIMQKERPEAVIHQAAQPSVPRSIEDPSYDASVNVEGSVNILEACRKGEVQKIIFSSTAAVYGNPRYLPLSEEHPVELLAPYGISKYAVEQYLKVYKDIHGIDFTVLRYANVYGPRQDAAGEGGVVSIFADRLLNNDAVNIYGDGEQTRDFIYVKDVAAANAAALCNGSGQVLNISTGKATTVNELFYTMKDVSGSSSSARYCSERPGDIKHSYLDNSLGVKQLEWKPGYNLQQGLKETMGLS